MTNSQPWQVYMFFLSFVFFFFFWGFFLNHGKLGFIPALQSQAVFGCQSDFLMFTLQGVKPTNMHIYSVYIQLLEYNSPPLCTVFAVHNFSYSQPGVIRKQMTLQTSQGQSQTKAMSQRLYRSPHFLSSCGPFITSHYHMKKEYGYFKRERETTFI